jgi:purine nucleoside phosphorylase
MSHARTLGADCGDVGSTEIIVATSRGMQTLSISMITNVIAKDGTNATNHEEVVAVLK